MIDYRYGNPVYWFGHRQSHYITELACSVRAGEILVDFFFFFASSISRHACTDVCTSFKTAGKKPLRVSRARNQYTNHTVPLTFSTCEQREELM